MESPHPSVRVGRVIQLREYEFGRLFAGVGKSWSEVLDEFDSGAPDELFHYTDTAALITLIAVHAPCCAKDGHLSIDFDNMPLCHLWPVGRETAREILRRFLCVKYVAGVQPLFWSRGLKLNF